MAVLPPPAFHRFAPPAPRHGVILSVPHAGRDYDGHINTRDVGHIVRPALHRLISLEDRHADLLITQAVQEGAAALVASAPRLMIDLNRSEQDIDPGMVADPIAHQSPISAKARGGLGVIPRRTSALGDLWSRKLTAAEVHARIETMHRPYHRALEEMLKAARARTGCAVLLDIHSMPPLRPEKNQRPVQIVIGDRHGRAAHGAFTEAACHAARAMGFDVAINAPYPGNYMIERHGAPHANIHALQIEVDRSLYLDGALMAPGPGLPTIQRLIAAIVDAVAREAESQPYAVAAE